MGHEVIKPEKVAGVAAVQLQDKLVLPNLFQKETFDAYKGAKDDTVNTKIEGVLPWHDYTWRQDAKDREPIVYDEYKERKVGVKLGANMYSGVQLTDEQNELDEISWAFLTDKQTDAVSNGLNYKAADFMTDDANFTVGMGISEDNLFAGLIKARQVAGRIHMPGTFTIALGSDWEAALLLDGRLNLAQNVGDDVAKAAVTEASLGRKLGFNFIVIPEMEPDEAVLFGSQAFVFANAAPQVPQSVPFGATASKNGVSMRVIRHYNHEKFVDESVVNTWYGFRTIKDVLAARKSQSDTQLTVSTSEYNVRAIKLTLNGTGGINGTSAEKAELTALTKVKESDLTVAAPATSSTNG